MAGAPSGQELGSVTQRVYDMVSGVVPIDFRRSDTSMTILEALVTHPCFRTNRRGELNDPSSLAAKIIQAMAQQDQRKTDIYLTNIYLMSGRGDESDGYSSSGDIWSVSLRPRDNEGEPLDPGQYRLIIELETEKKDRLLRLIMKWNII